MSLSFGVAFCILLLVEWFRLVCHSYELSQAVNHFFDQFIDDRYAHILLSLTKDRNFLMYLNRDTSRGIAVTHLYLLLGCAAPVWATVYYCALEETMDTKYSARSTSFENIDLGILLILPHLGWIIIGVGDSFVSEPWYLVRCVNTESCRGPLSVKLLERLNGPREILRL